MSPADAPRLDDQLCFALYAASRATVNAYRDHLARIGLTYPQFVTLLALWERDGMGMGELGERLRLDNSTLSPLLKRMEGMGLLERRRCSTDERRVEVWLTPAGVAKAGPALEAQREVACRVRLTPDEADTLRLLATRLTLSLEDPT
ncbi:MarR family transcriptional regulator [Mobilicoccus sp.]|uniref:MarR family winged helix-turn-helix transcriptional regulator n=1 Tax=Mobilicoccus sp. TaxID=2034349 RepID=UPI002898AD8D|nr:MarR family transcriptional regulator [Mobilicoccus sp.]